MYEINDLKNYKHMTSPKIAHTSPASGGDYDQHSLSLNYMGHVSEMSGSAVQLNIDAMNKADEKRVLAFAADACALCCLQCTGALALMLYMVQIGLWSWAFHEIYTNMPKTFAWEKLLRTYGSHYDDCVDRSGPIEIELKPWSLCPNYYTMPCVPILAIVLLIANFFSGSSCLSRPKSKRMYTMVASSTTWQFLFTVIAIAFTSYYFHTDIRALEQDMSRDMSKGLPPTGRWELTQTIQRCCGLKNYTDWVKFINSTVDNFPKSCYPEQKLNSGSESIFDKGCYPEEYSTVRFWAAFEIGLLCSGLVTSVVPAFTVPFTTFNLFFLCLATAIHGGARGNWSPRKSPGENENTGTADVFFVSNPHQRHHQFHHRNQIHLEDAESGGFHVHQTPGIVLPASDSLSAVEQRQDFRL